MHEALKRPWRGAAATAAALALLGALTAFTPPVAEAQQLDVREIQLDNGMEVLLLPRKGDPSVAAGWVAKTGSVNEWPGITGISHLTEHMLFKGTHAIGTKNIKTDLELIEELDRIRVEIIEHQRALDRRQRLGEVEDSNDPAARSPEHQALIDEFNALIEKQREILVDNEFDQIYTKHGASQMNAGTAQDFTVYFITIPANKLELWFWMEADRLRTPVFRQFYSELDVVLEERRMRVDSTPTGRLDEQYEAMFWMGSPYSWPVVGWESDIRAYTRHDAEDYFKRQYSPHNLTAALVGDFDVDEAEKLARKYFAPLERSKNEPNRVRTFEPAQLAPKKLEGEAETLPTVRIRWHVVPHGHADEPALAVLGDLLNGRTGRLYKALVEESEIATSASAQLDTRKHGGFFEVQAVASPDKPLEQVEMALVSELTRLQDELVATRELEKVKNQTLAGKYRRLTSNFFILLQLLLYDNLNDWRDMTTEADKILAVTPADVKRVASTYFPDEGRNVAYYRTKPTEGEEDDDPLWAALDPQQRMMATQIRQQVDAASDPAELEGAIAQFDAMKSQAPPEAAPVLDWALSYVRARIASLKGGSS